MSKLRRSVLFQSLFVLAAIPAAVFGQQKQAAVLHLAETIQLDRVQGGFDHFAYDASRGRLLLAASDNGTVEVMDVPRAHRIKSITGFQHPHSILILPGASKILVTDSGPNASAIISATALEKTRQLNLALGANCLLFDPQTKKAYVTAGGDRVGERSSSLQIVNPVAGDVLKSINIDVLHLQPMALDAKTGRLFVNLADKNAIGIYNSGTLNRIGIWPIPQGSKNSPIVFDPERHRLFVIASDSGILLELNGDSGKLEASIATPPTPDDMAFDPITQRVFVPGDGGLAVYDVASAGRIRLLQRIKTGADARTGLLFASAKRFAVAVPATKNDQARVLIFDVR
jgi:DNA-binding beta-propeller fold protein YncE